MLRHEYGAQDSQGSNLDTNPMYGVECILRGCVNRMQWRCHASRRDDECKYDAKPNVVTFTNWFVVGVREVTGYYTKVFVWLRR